jgi:hypothetical protein
MTRLRIDPIMCQKVSELHWKVLCDTKIICRVDTPLSTYMHTMTSAQFRMTYLAQGCQMEYFQTKNPNLGKFWRVL